MCNLGNGPSREFWFQVNADADPDSGHADFDDLPAYQFRADGSLVRGHVVVHVHYAGTGAAPDFTRIEHANVRFALSRSAASAAGVHLKEFSSSAPALAFAIDGEGVRLTGGTKPTRMCMTPPWEWQAEEGMAGMGAASPEPQPEPEREGGSRSRYPAFRLPTAAEAPALHASGGHLAPYIRPFAEAAELYDVLSYAESVRRERRQELEARADFDREDAAWRGGCAAAGQPEGEGKGGRQGR